MYDEEGLYEAIEKMEKNTGFDMSRIAIDYNKKRVYSFPFLNDILKVLKSGDRLISQEEAKEKLLRCVGSFYSGPYIVNKREIIYMGVDGPPNSKGEQKHGRVNLKTGEVIQCITRGPPELLDDIENIRGIDTLDNQPAPEEEGIIKKVLDWLLGLFR